MKRFEKKLKKSPLSSSEEGSVLIVALIMMILITLMGISATTNTNIELQIAGNDMVHKKNLYGAEASAMKAVQTMENTNLETSPPSWVTTGEGVINDADVRGDGNWGDNNFGGDVGDIGIATEISNDCEYVAVFEGMNEIQESLDMAKTRIYSYTIYGRSNQQNGVSVVKMGYRKAF